jgi:UrcA family protein
MSSTQIIRLALSYRPFVRYTAALGLLLTATAVNATPATDMVLERVRIDTFNLSSDAGAHAVLRELSGAAKRVCGVGNSRDLAHVVHEKACYREALANAVDAVRNEHLTQLYRATSGVG